jgi:predicted TIM-barrel fold metal-dependent hydrolase
MELGGKNENRCFFSHFDTNISTPRFSAMEDSNRVPSLTNLDIRFRIMDKYEGLVQVLTTSLPPLESTAPDDAVELAKIANDEVAELVLKYPDKFVGAVACLPMNNMDAALNEVDRAINDLSLRGVQIYAHINGKAIDLPEFMPLYEKMAHYNLPIWIHPVGTIGVSPDKQQDPSGYLAHRTFGRPYESTIALSRLVFSGIMEKYPSLKIITHHCGGMVPYFAQRVAGSIDYNAMRKGIRYGHHLPKRLLDYYRMFYHDTAVQGNTSALMCAHAFCGADHLLFGTDMPFDSQIGDRYTRDTIRSIEEMNIPDREKRKIFEDNARELIRLPI